MNVFIALSERIFAGTVLFLGCCLLFTSVSESAARDEYAKCRNRKEGVEITEPVSGDSYKELLVQGERLQGRGDVRLAVNFFRAAVKHAAVTGSTRQKVVAVSALGNGLLLAGQHKQAEEKLRLALTMAEENGFQDLVVINSNHLARLFVSQGKEQMARTLYLQALSLAEKEQDALLACTVRVNLADIEEQTEALSLLQKAFAESESFTAGTEKVTLLLAIAYRSVLLGDDALSYRALTAARILARRFESRRQLSQASGILANLYEKANRNNEALHLIADAIFTAQQVEAVDLLMKWEWQQGQLLEKMGMREQALDSFRLAVSHLQAIRADIPVQYTNGHSSFRETLEPLLFGFADLLLRQAAIEEEQAKNRKLLLEVQKTVELVKTAELQDYYMDTCAAIQRPLMDLEQVAPGTAVVYPILLKDRLEILYSIGSEIGRVTVPVTRRRLERSVKRVASSLRPAPGGRLSRYQQKLSGRIYGWLIEPLEKYLQKHGVHTLVYVPDGVLRSLPISALWSKKDKKYLVEKYAVATVPGLSLMDPKPAGHMQMKALLAGISRPGDAVSELPSSMKMALAGIDSEESTKRDASTTAEDNRQSGKNRKSKADMTKTLQDALTLPGVIPELVDLKKQLPSRELLDSDFSVENFKEEMTGDYRIVHIASHGFFTGSAEESFVMAYDRLLDMNELEALFKSEAFSDAPVEILTLSACQTAEGDDRSPLGLSGIALKSGARSALGSLWPVSDESTRKLLPDFYANLRNGSMTKAQALQQAQKNLLLEKRFRHPALWSAFILIGNWL